MKTMTKCVTVKISVEEPTTSYGQDPRWERLENYAGNCPIPHSYRGYCFNRAGEVVWGRPYCDYNYNYLSEDDADKIRVYWTQAALEIGISPDDIEVQTWDASEEWPTLDTDEPAHHP